MNTLLSSNLSNESAKPQLKAELIAKETMSVQINTSSFYLRLLYHCIYENRVRVISFVVNMLLIVGIN